MSKADKVLGKWAASHSGKWAASHGAPAYSAPTPADIINETLEKWAAPPEAVIRKPETCRMAGVSYSTIRRLYLKGDFPPPVKISPRATGFILREVKEWIADRAASRDAAPTAKQGGGV